MFILGLYFSNMLIWHEIGRHSSLRGRAHVERLRLLEGTPNQSGSLLHGRQVAHGTLRYALFFEPRGAARPSALRTSSHLLLQIDFQREGRRILESEPSLGTIHQPDGGFAHMHRMAVQQDNHRTAALNNDSLVKARKPRRAELVTKCLPIIDTAGPDHANGIEGVAAALVFYHRRPYSDSLCEPHLSIDTIAGPLHEQDLGTRRANQWPHRFNVTRL